MDSINLQKAKRTAKKLALQNRLAAKKRHASLVDSFGHKFEFLDAETTLALWFSVSNKWNPDFPYSGFVSCKVEQDFSGYLARFSDCFTNINSLFGFCFPLDWAVTGAFIIDLHELMKNLDGYMFDFDDEMRFFSPDLTKAIILKGERSGMGDLLCELSVSVLGADWIKKWTNGSE